MSERTKILEMVHEGIITPSEAEELLEVLNRCEEEKELDKDTLEKIKERLDQFCKKIEEWDKKTSENFRNSDFYKGVKKVLKKIESRLDKIYNKSIKENFQDIGKGFKKFGKKIAAIFKNERTEEASEEDKQNYIELVEEELEKEENINQEVKNEDK